MISGAISRGATYVDACGVSLGVYLPDLSSSQRRRETQKPPSHTRGHFRIHHIIPILLTAAHNFWKRCNGHGTERSGSSRSEATPR